MSGLRLFLEHPLFVLRRSRLVRRVLERADVPARARPRGVAFPLDVRLGPNLSLVLGRFGEAAERRYFAQLAAALDPPVFWDIGANVGLYWATFLTCRPEGRVLAVEPDPDNLACLRRSLSRTPGLRGKLVAAACADSCGRAAFGRDTFSGASGALVTTGPGFGARHYGADAPVLQVETVTLDALLQRGPAPALVKLDIEGAEVLALRGGPRLLSEVRPILLMETFVQRGALEAELARHAYTWVDAVTLAPCGESANIFAFPAEQAARWLEILQSSD